MRVFFTLLFFSLGIVQSTAQNDDTIYFTTGFKIGEVTHSSAIILTRLCKTAKPVAIYHEQKNTTFRPPIDFDNSMPVQKMEGAVEGAAGQVKITLKSKDTTITTDWEYVSGYKDFTIKQKFDGLASNTTYAIIIQGRKNSDATSTEIKGAFTTAPSADEAVPILFTSSTCQYFWSHDDPQRGFKIYDSMRKLNPSFHCQTGDYVYYDKPGPMAYTVELARHKWHAMNSWPALVDFYSSTSVYQQKDDHDLLKDDTTPYSTPFGELSYLDGLDIWREQVPIIEKPYRTVRWGKDLQVWMVDVREFRSDNKAPDGKEKTIWGAEQIEWFKETVETSDASFKILVSPTPVVGPDRSKGKFDNHSNRSFETEGEWLRKYLATQKVFVINGDRHWQYVSVDPKTGLREFSQGPVSDNHAQGWDPNDIRPEHKFLRVKGGFLAVNVFRDKKTPTIQFTHYDVDGAVVNQEVIKAPK
ncbi:alkaline phosphatase D family protein [Aurantibacter crassamenti]|uniref:alkaline phosphatase D family protein n=1 Tax=Aurantibacter crassamenti TaxID=1837375 RepID=UPI00193ADBA0|nr:alkaline phosphatase D family protein [Aurantibacter crassamenti]MBM1108242.1 alkaline phosphatase D family protein [Aurantibacter crassamenti]